MPENFILVIFHNWIIKPFSCASYPRNVLDKWEVVDRSHQLGSSHCRSTVTKWDKSHRSEVNRLWIPISDRYNWQPRMANTTKHDTNRDKYPHARPSSISITHRRTSTNQGDYTSISWVSAALNWTVCSLWLPCPFTPKSTAFEIHFVLLYEGI